MTDQQSVEINFDDEFIIEPEGEEEDDFFNNVSEKNNNIIDEEKVNTYLKECIDLLGRSKENLSVLSKYMSYKVRNSEKNEAQRMSKTVTSTN